MKSKKMGGRGNPFALMRYTTGSRGILLAFLIMAPVSAVLEVALAYAMAAAVDYAMYGELSEIGKYVLWFGFYIILNFLGGYGYKRIRWKLLTKTMADLKIDLHASILSMSLDSFQQRNSAEYISEMTTYMDILQNSYFSIILGLYPEGLKFIISTIAIFFISPVMGFFVLLLAVAQMCVPHFFSEQISEKGKTAAKRQEEHLVALKENFLSFQTVKMFHLAEIMKDKQREKAQKAEDAKYRSKSLNALSYELSFVFGCMMYLGIYLVGAWLVMKGYIRIADVICVSQLMVYVTSPLTSISGDIAEFKSSSQIAEEVLNILHQERVPDGGIQKSGVEKGVILQDVSFSYGERTILNHISFSFEKGKKYLILGESGCGKSTLLQLISRMYQPDSGRILLDQDVISEIRSEDYVKMVSCIPQEPFLYDDTLGNNVALFRNTEPKQVIRALQDAGLEEYLKRHPEGIEVKIGENASQMSGGEKQRISIARVLLAGSPIILMDESTSHLDPDTAAEIETFLFQLPDVMVIFVTHAVQNRTKELADMILELRDGKLHERDIKTL